MYTCSIPHDRCRGGGLRAPAGILGADDIDFLVGHFSLPELRRQAHASDVDAAIARNGDEIELALYYDDVAAAMRLAADILISSRPKPQPIPGRQRIDVAALKETVDIVSIAERYTRLKKAGGRFEGKCPLHEQRTGSFNVYPDDGPGSWYCFSCHQGGDVITLVQLAEHLDFRAACEALR